MGKKIGIMTYWTSKDNYGQQLQYFALQQYLRMLGYEPFLIQYDMSRDKEDVFVEKVLRKMFHCYKAFVPGYLRKNMENKKLQKKCDELIKNELLEHPRHFDEFRKKYFSVSEVIYFSYQQLKKNPPEADYYMAGSDQIWHFPLKSFRRAKSVIRAYMLDFGSDEAKRVSVAASWGRTRIPEQWKTKLKPLLERFDAITVREDSGVELCRQCGEDATLVADPTLYLNVENYRALYKDNEIRKPKDKYVMVYWVNNGGTPPMEEVFRWANERNLSVEYVTANGMIDQYNKNYATVPEWLFLIDHAEYVISNSFHAGVFSLLFNKKFGVIKIEGHEKGMNDRMKNLFYCCNVSERYIHGDDFSCLDMEPEAIRLDNILFLKEAIADKVTM